MLLAEVIHGGGVFDELIWPTDAHHRSGDLLAGEEFQHGAAVTAGDDVVFQRDDRIRTLGEEFRGGFVQRLEPARVDDGHVVTFTELFHNLVGHLLHRPEREDGNFLAAVVRVVLHHFGLADFEQLLRFLDGNAFCRATRVADEAGVLGVGGSEHHVRQFVFVGRGHADDIGQAAQVGDIKQAVMRRAVVGRETSAVHTEDHGQILQADVVMDAIVGALQEGGVNGDNRAEAHGGHTSGEDDGVLFRDADIVVTAGHGFLERLQAGARRHGGGDAYHGVILAAEADHHVTEDILVSRRCAGFRGGGLAGFGVVRTGAVEFLRVLEGGVEAFALLGEHVDDHGFFARLGVFQRADEQLQIVTINRSDVLHAHLFEDEAAAESATAFAAFVIIVLLEGDFGDDTFHRFFGLVAQAHGEFARGAPLLEEGGGVLLQTVVARVGDELVEIVRDGANVLGDAPLVIIQDTDELLGGMRDVVQRLEGDTVRERSVTEDADHVFIRAALIARGAHAEGGGERRTGVTGTVAIMLALRAERETVQTARGADGMEAVFAAGEQLVHVNLVADVPDELVLGRREHVVHGDGEFHHAEVRAEVAAVLGELRDQLVTDFIGKLGQLVQLQLFDVGRMVHHVQVSAHNWLINLPHRPPGVPPGRA